MRGTRPRSGCAALAVIAALSLSVLPAGALSSSEAPPGETLAPANSGGGLYARTLRYGVALAGFSSPYLPAGEITDLSLTLEPEQPGRFRPFLGVHLFLPADPYASGQVRIGAGAGFAYRSAPARGFRDGTGIGQGPGQGRDGVRIFSRDWVWAPSVGLLGMARFAAPLDPLAVLSLAPIRAFTGDGYYTFLGLDLLGRGRAFGGWGIRLFEFSYFFF